MKKFRAVLAVMVVLMLMLSIPASAYGTGKAYVYNHNMETMEIPDPYQVVSTVGGNMNLVDPVDMVVLDEKIFILDAGIKDKPGSAKIYILNSDLTFCEDENMTVWLGLSAYESDEDGNIVDSVNPLPGALGLRKAGKDAMGNLAYEPLSFKQATGLWVVDLNEEEGGDPNYRYYIADAQGNRVYVFDNDGVAEVIDEGEKAGELLTYGKPNTPLMSDISADKYSPTDVITDHLGTLYVRVKGDYRGFVMLDPNVEDETEAFLGYFGSNEIVRTADVIALKFFSKFMTQAQLDRTQQVTPMEYSGLCIDKEGDFIYGVRGATDDMNELVRKLNCKGNNVLDYKESFGDTAMITDLKGTKDKTSFSSITVDEDGFITTFDSSGQRMFQYTSDGELMYVFGGEGSQQGTFSDGADIESWGDRLFILDSEYNTITVMEPTAFGANVRQGQIYYSEGKYELALKPFRDVVTECMNYEFGYAGIGKAMYMQNQYAEAMDMFYLAHDQENYSMAFKMYRGEMMRELTVPMVGAVIGLIVLLVVLKILKKKGIIKQRQKVYDEAGKGKYVIHTLLHPIESYEEMRYNKKYSLGIANVAIFFFFFSTVIMSLYSGFIFNGTSASTYNMLFTIVGILGGFTLFVIVNWLMSSFFEGKGKLKEVWIYLGYATIPYSVTCFLYTLLSNFLTAEEGTFLAYLMIIGQGWALIMAFFALQGVHMYTFKRNIVSILVTILGMLVVIFIVFLLFNLFIQLFSFGESIITELMYRMTVGF